MEDIIDEKFVTEERLQNESAMYRILNGIFQDPFQDLRPRTFKPKQEQGAFTKKKIEEKKQKRGRPVNKKKKKKKPQQKPK